MALRTHEVQNNAWDYHPLEDVEGPYEDLEKGKTQWSKNVKLPEHDDVDGGHDLKYQVAEEPLIPLASEDSDLGDGGDFESFSGNFFNHLFYHCGNWKNSLKFNGFSWLSYVILSSCYGSCHNY